MEINLIGGNSIIFFCLLELNAVNNFHCINFSFHVKKSTENRKQVKRRIWENVMPEARAFSDYSHTLLTTLTAAK